VNDAQLTEHLHARGWSLDKIDVAMIREGAAAIQAEATGDCDQAFEEHYKCSARDPSNAGDLAKFRDGWTAAVTAAANLYGEGDVAAPVGNSAWGEARQEGWIDGTQAYRDAIRRLDAGRGGSRPLSGASADHCPICGSHEANPHYSTCPSRGSA
jgi:hypothetical protein